MKIPIVALPLIVALTAGCSPPVSVLQTAEPSNGYIVLDLENHNGGEEHNCTIPIANRKFNLDGETGDDPECNNNDTHYFRLENVPSATYISFYNDRHCTDQENEFYFMIRTIKQPTTMPARVDMIKAGQLPEGSIIAPGIQLVESNYENINDDLSCIEMKLSPKP